MKYRPEIDGLRAVAILPVVAYHLVILKGGFIGVDVFFVISGYLISSIIFDELRNGRFSLARFYERRVRRIAPALCAMLMVVLGLSLVVMAPPDTVNVAQSAIAAVTSWSNVYFWLHSGYFENPSSTMPLLHTWSLGVEEQYYVVFPLVMMAWNRFRPGRFLEIILPVFAISLWFSVQGAMSHDPAAFYLLHSRAFELMLGSIAALNLVPAPDHRPLREALASIGLLAIVIPVFAYNDRLPFPGFAALVPCVGTMLVIMACRKPTLVGWLLSLPSVTFVGLISYSLYIWHWPVIILQRANWLFYTGDSKVTERLLVLAISFALAILSWKYIEGPFRTSEWAKSRRTIFGTFAMAAVVIAGLSTAMVATNGFPNLLPCRQSSYSAYIAYDPQPVLRAGTCMLDERTTLDPACLQDEPGKPNVVLLGDSHAAHLWFGLKTVFPEVNVLQLTGSSCQPTMERLASAYENCKVLLSEVFPRVMKDHRVDLVVLAGHWVQTGGEGAVAFADGLRAKGIPVLLVGPVPNYARPLPRLLQLGLLTNNPLAPARFAVPGQFEIDRAIERDAQARRIPYISPLQLLCPREQCRTLVGNVPLQFDSNHLTAEGSVFLAGLMRTSGLLQASMAHHVEAN